MSQYSQMIGSFERTGNYPMEANYIFATEEALKEFYSDPVNASTLHKGLLRVVENDGSGKQGLYWVTKKQTNDELEFTRLVSGTNIQGIDEWLDRLQKQLDTEIKNRQDMDKAILGTSDLSLITPELNSLLNLSEAIIDIREDLLRIHAELIDSDDSIQKSLKTELKATVGTPDDNIVEYLKNLPYQSLTEVATALNKFLNTVDNSTSKINTLPELKFFLEGYTDTLKLRHVLMDLLAEILGNPLPTEEFRTLRAIEDFVRILKADSENVDDNLQSELNQTQIGVGLSGDGSYNPDKTTNYLRDATSVMNALKTLDGLMHEALQEMVITTSNKDVVDLNVRKELEGYVIGANLKLSNVLGNDLIKKDDGLYFNVKSTYNNGILSLYVNDKLIAQHTLGFSSIVEQAAYIPSQEAIVIVFKLLDGERQTVTIPVGNLIREWEIDNAQPEKVVELTRTTVVDGPDELSADVRINTDRTNILVKRGNTLYVDGRSTNITHNDEQLSVVIENIKNSILANTSAINKEAARATAKEELLQQIIEANKTDIESKLDAVEDATNLEVAKVAASVANEVNRATEAENNLKTQIQDSKDEIALLKETDKTTATKISNLELADTQLGNRLDLEKLRAEAAEGKLEQRISSVEGELSAVSTQVGTFAESIRNKADQSAVDSLTEKTNTIQQDLQTEVLRAKEKEGEISAEVAKKVGSVKLEKVNDLTYSLLVDGNNIGQITIPATLSAEYVEAELNKKANIDSPTFTGIPQVETSPDAADASQRIPSTNWVRDRITEAVLDIEGSNAYTKAEVNALLANKADLVDGIVPKTQLPKLTWIEVE